MAAKLNSLVLKIRLDCARKSAKSLPDCVEFLYFRKS
jgi:hypothetical protein